MKHLIRRLSRVADSSSTSSTTTAATSTAAISSSYSLLRSDSLASPRPPRRRSISGRRRRSAVPSGHVPVYVGGEEAEMERFVISADLVNHPIFAKLLNRSAQEYGYEQKGALRIPCNVVVFQKLLDAITHGGHLSRDLIDSLSSDDHLFL